MLRLGFSPLSEHKFANNFQDSLNLLCTRGCDIEYTRHLLLHCPNFLAKRNTLLKKTTDIDS